MNEYPLNWKEIAGRVKDRANWRCVRCGHPHDPSGSLTCDHRCDQDRHLGEAGRQRVLTVHHLDGNKANVLWWNLAALCQQCHLHIQHKVVMERVYLFEHSAWFKPYVAGYYAHLMGLNLSESEVRVRIKELQHLTEIPDEPR